MPNCGLALPCSQTASSGGPLLAITNSDVTSGGAVFGNCPNSGAAGLHGASIRDNGQAFGIGVAGTPQLGAGVQGTSVAGIGFEGHAGLPAGGDRRIQSIGVLGAGDFGGTGVVGTSSGGIAGSFQNRTTDATDIPNNNQALDAGASGTGDAAFFHIDNPASTQTRSWQSAPRAMVWSG